MNETTKHTKTPWTTKGVFVLIEKRDQPKVICCMADAPTSIEARANAAHIVKCVNAHDALVEAAYGVETLYAEMSAALPAMVGTRGFDLVQEAVRKARATLASINADKPDHA